ncbi:MAG: sugar phosphate isomerase/epimerase [Prolixibacteraceae bacterium]|jgi:sugar phosphate isomerase/epimerase|nr:sugar phosphate isomerase/epimerase [Prolixibacteraceae bacterium]
MGKKQEEGRRIFLKNLGMLTGAMVLPTGQLAFGKAKKQKMKLGFVTYLWGKDWDQDTLIKNLTASAIQGVELRVEHAHKVSTTLTAEERKTVRKKFRDSPVQIIGMGTNQQYDYPEPAKLRESIEQTKAFFQLSHDIGGLGVKVKPNQFRAGIPHEKTIEQIGLALNELAKFGADMGQKLRLEVHGNETQELPNIKAIMDVANHPNATVCWNCNPQDLTGNGLEANFNLVKDRFGDICHVRELDDTSYPYQDLMNLFLKNNYEGWILLECRTDPADKVKALISQREIFEKMTGKR